MKLYSLLVKLIQNAITHGVKYIVSGVCACSISFMSFAQCNFTINLTSMGTPCIGHDTLNVLGAGAASQIVWQNGGSTVGTSHYGYTTCGVTVAGDANGGFGIADSLLTSPNAVWVDHADNLYVADKSNNRIQMWAPGATRGVTVAGDPLGTSSVAANRLNSPSGIYVDQVGNVYIADEGNNRVQKWAPGATSGVTVAGNPLGTAGVSASLLNQPLSVWVDASGNVYVSDQNNNRVQKWAPGASSGVTVAGDPTGTPGSTGALLNTPAGVAVDAAGNVYVADAINNRVQKWAPGASSGYTVAGDSMGTNGIFNYRLWYPYGVYLDAGGALYVADGSNNRIQKWLPGATAGSTVAGSANGTIGVTNCLFNFSLSVFVKDSQIYIADYGNNRVQRWGPSISTTFVPPGAGYYTAIVTSFSGCSDTTAVIYIDSNQTPAVTIQTGHTTQCGTMLDTFVVSSFSGGGLHPGFQWFKNGTLVGSGQTYISSNINNGDSIWVVMTTSSSCYTKPTDTSSKIYMTVQQAAIPTVHISATTLNICGTAIDTFSAAVTGVGTQPVYQWYLNNNPVGTGQLSYINSSLSNNDSIWMVMTTNAVCGITSNIVSNKLHIQVGQFSAPAVSISAGTLVMCSSAIDTFSISSISGAGATPAYQWYRNGLPVSTVPTYITGGLHDADSIWLVVTTSSACATVPTATSQTVHLSVHPVVTPGIQINATSVSMCGQVADTFSSVSVNGGSAATYQWYVNNTAVGSSLNHYITNSLNNNDSIWVVMTTSALCASRARASSNVIHVSVGSYAAPTISIATASDTVCTNRAVTFTASSFNGGAAPLYQWKKNGVVVANSATYTANPVYNGDVIFCILTSNARCTTQHTATSNSYTMTVFPTPIVTVDVLGHTKLCPGDSLDLMARGGTYYQWSNAQTSQGIQVTASGSYIVTVTNSYGCTAASSPVNVTVYPPHTPLIAQSGSVLTCSPAITYQWYSNGATLIGDTGQSYTVSHGGGYYVSILDSNGCRNFSGTILFPYPAGMDEVSIGSAKLYPDPSRGVFTLDLGDPVERMVSIADAAGKIVSPSQAVISQKEYDLSGLLPGMYFLYIRQGQQCRVIKIALLR